MIIKLTGIELYKIFKKWRAYIGFIGITVIILLMQYNMLANGQRYLSHMTRNLNNPLISFDIFLNGYLVAYFILQVLLFQLPFLLSIVASDLLAGEAVAGTFRILVTRPVSRFSIVTSKYLAAIIYTCILLLWFIILSMGLGIELFGTGDLLVINKGPLILPEAGLPQRFLEVYLFSTLAMISISSLAFLFSSIVENAIGPIVSTITVIIVFSMISNLNVELFEDIRPYLFTNYINNWKLFFEITIDNSVIIKSIAILGGHSLAFYLATLYIFYKKDILT